VVDPVTNEIQIFIPDWLQRTMKQHKITDRDLIISRDHFGGFTPYPFSTNEKSTYDDEW